MVAVGMLLIWGGYGVGLWGWCLVRDYDVTLGQLLSPAHPYSGTWPPAPIPASQTWPGGQSASAQQQAAAKPKSKGILGDIESLPGIAAIKKLTGL